MDKQQQLGKNAKVDFVLPAVPVKFAHEMMIINNIDIIRRWLKNTGAPAEIVAMFNALDWAIDYTIMAAGADGRVMSYQDPNRADFVVWLQAMYKVAESLDYPLYVAA